jgi:hypothetical protein
MPAVEEQVLLKKLNVYSTFPYETRVRVKLRKQGTEDHTKEE